MARVDAKTAFQIIDKAAADARRVSGLLSPSPPSSTRRLGREPKANCGRISSGRGAIRSRVDICYEVCWSAVVVVGVWWVPGVSRVDAIFAPFAIHAMRPAPVTGGV